MGMGLCMRLAAEAKDRGLDPVRLQQKFGVYSASGSGGSDGALVIPYLRHGEIRNRKYRTSLEPGCGGGKQWQDGREKRAIRLLYNEDALRNSKLKGQPVIITEGEPDLWALDLAGYERIVGWPDGAPEESIPLDADSPKYRPLEDAITEGLFRTENLGGPDVPIILAVDGDEAGAVLLHDLAIRLGRARCKFVTFPLSKTPRGRARCKDLGEVLEDYGAQGVVKTIERAQWVAMPGVYRLSDLPPRPKPRVLEIGMPHLCNSIRLRLGDFSVWTGIPAMGKTTLVNDIANRIVEDYSTDSDPFVVTHASFEQEPQVDHRRNLRWWVHKQHPSKLSDIQLASADAWIDTHFRFLVPNEQEDVSLEWVLDASAQSVVRDRSQLLVVDPWNEMDHTRLPGESVTDYTGRAIKAFRRFARNMGIHVAVVAHPTKVQAKPDGTYPIPTLYSISDSAHWFNKCDVGTVVHREGNRSIIWVQKTRYEDEIGRGNVKYEAIYHHGERRFDVQGRWSGGED